MKSKIFAPLFSLAILVLSPAFSYAQNADWANMSDYLSGLGISRETSDDLKDLIEYRSEPIIKSVTIDNEEPSAGEPVSVTAVVASPPEMTGDSISEVALNYSLDNGETWERVAMEQDEDDKRVWRGTIPGQQSGAEVILGVQATNYSDESAVEVVCRTDGAQVKSGDEISAECENDRTPDICQARRPVGCLFPMSVSSDEFKEYEVAAKAPLDDLNIRVPRVGWDDGKIYVDIPVKGKVSPGKLSPPNIHVYVAGWVNPDRGSSETGLEAIFKQGAAVIYAPLNPTEQCAIYSLRTNSMDIDRASAMCVANDDHLVFALKRKAFEPNPSRMLEFLLLTFNQREIAIPDVKLEDASIITRVYFVDRGYVVQ